MLRIGITGQSGFIGGHLYNTVGLFPEEFSRTIFRKEYFDNEALMDAFVASCDVIVHLAGVNRHQSAEVLAETNIGLADKLIAAMVRTGSKPHVLFSSSTQEERDNHYGRSKKEARVRLHRWAGENGATFTGLVIPNVFGPFGHPKYNSVVATFCYQIARGEAPTVDGNSELKLIYVGELVNYILGKIRSGERAEALQVPHTATTTLLDLLETLRRFRSEYQDRGIIPALRNPFELNLFNSYRCYMPLKEHFPVKFTQHQDPRGAFVEIIRLNQGGQVSFSTTRPGITRGNHFHTRKIERFAVIKGQARIQLRRVGTEEVLDFFLSGEEPAYVDMPVWYTHNIKNVGEEDLYTIFWINEFFDPADADTYFLDV